MIEKFFIQQQTLFRIREGLLGPHLPALAKALDEAHYSMATIRLHLRAAGHFGVWLQKKSIAVADVSEVTVASYIRGLGPADAPHPRPMAGSRIALLAFTSFSSRF